MNKYEDCESCAFGDGSAEGICDECDNADQWEDIEGSFDSTNLSPKLCTAVKIDITRLRKAA